jgi:hypothetical protein
MKSQTFRPNIIYKKDINITFYNKSIKLETTKFSRVYKKSFHTSKNQLKTQITKFSKIYKKKIFKYKLKTRKRNATEIH